MTLADLAYRTAKPWLFRINDADAESAHEWMMRRLEKVSHSPRRQSVIRRLMQIDAPEPVAVFGLSFANRVGLAAGMDKSARALHAWSALGFGHIEAGTVTWLPQPGNPTPRMFRLTESGAIINRMGFNNPGAQALARQLESVGKPDVPLGISIGKSKLTPIERAVEDYVASLREIRRYADYVAINVSSPNTVGLRALQDRGYLTELLAALMAQTEGVPLLVKIAPDLTDEAIGELLSVLTDAGVAGVIATNTTIRRSDICAADQHWSAQAGGLSGAPLRSRAREVVRFIHTETSGALPIIGVGGIAHADDGLAMLDAGATLIQLYTGFVYGGPQLLRTLIHATSSYGVNGDE
ncbi:MAG: quinone-dependent dihydroorotate dehydrogenase [Antricoccus sp.]